MAYGVSSTGFLRKRLADIKAEIEDSFRTTFGNIINLLPSSVFSQLIGIFAEREDSIWELAEATYNSRKPNSALCVNLDDVAAILGITRLAATKSSIMSVNFYGDVGTLIPAGSQFSVDGNPLAVFETLSAVTLIAGVDEQQLVTFQAIPDAGSFKLVFYDETTAAIPYNANLSDVLNALNALPKANGQFTATGSIATNITFTFAGDLGQTDHPLLEITENTLTLAAAPVTVVVTEAVAGVNQGVSDMQSLTTGPFQAPIFKLTDIVNPIAGLDRVLNTNAAIVGRNVETDTAFRQRMKIAQSQTGKGTFEAIRTQLLNVLNVTQAIVYENTGDVTDGLGLPPKSFRAYVLGGADQDIFDSIWANKPAGIYPDGSEVGSVVDSQGTSQPVRFSRFDLVPVYMNVLIFPNDDFPVDGVDQVRAALADYIGSLTGGEDVIVYPKLIATLNNIVGIVGIEIGIDITPNPSLGTDDNIIIDLNEIAVVTDPSTDIEVNLD